MTRRALAVLAGLTAVLAAGPARAQTPAMPIPPDPRLAPASATAGPAATPQPIAAAANPTHPRLAPAPFGVLHDDGFMSDASTVGGPLGRDVQVTSTFRGGECGSLTRDRRGRLVTVCVRAEGPTLVRLDPVTLAELATFQLPAREADASVLGFLTDVSGGGYFVLDEQDRAVVPTADERLMIVATAADGVGFTLEREVDLAPLIGGDDQLFSVVPDWTGRLWVVTSGGRVTTVDADPGTPTPRPLDLGARIDNSLATDPDGSVYVVTTQALFRLRAGAGGAPEIVWREGYDNSQIAKPGQFTAGSGTTPTVLGGGYVAITDNADPMQVVVMKTEAAPDGPRKVCVQPVFGKGMSATENSLIGIGRTMVVANNFGYGGPVASSMDPTPSSAGMARVDLDRDGSGCRPVWTTDAVRAPSSVNKLSLATGLIYTYTRETTPDRVEAWSLTAVDARSGQVAWRRLVGTGPGFNSNYAPVTLAPGVAYVGVLGGLARVADRGPVAPEARAPGPDRVALRLRVRRLRDGRLELRLRGADADSVRRATVEVGGRERVFGGPARTTLRLSRRSTRRAPARLRATVLLTDGRTLVSGWRRR